MKAVVLETKNGYCAVLKDDGTVTKIKMKAEVGQEIELTPKAEIHRFPFRRIVAAASVALLAVSTGLLSFIQEYFVFTVIVIGTIVDSVVI